MTNSSTATWNAPVKRSDMLRSLKDLEGYRLLATDGFIGKIHDFLFDDEFWIIRYVVVDTGHIIPGRKALLAPSVLLEPNWYERSFSVALTIAQVKASPDINTNQPVSRQRQIELHTYYGWPYYWAGSGAVAPMPPTALPAAGPSTEKTTGDPHLRSVREVIGYHIEATDGHIGGVDDFIAEEEVWVIRYLVVATHKWLPGRKVLLAPQWLVGPISWSARIVKINLPRESIKHSPKFDPWAPVNREYEERLYDFYGRPQYWALPKPRQTKQIETVNDVSNMKTDAQPKNKVRRPRSKRLTSGRNVHFEFTDLTAHKVCVAGSFNDWKPEAAQMVRAGDGKWIKDLNLAPGTYEYRLVVDGHWETDPNADHTILNPFGERNSLLTVSK